MNTIVSYSEEFTSTILGECESIISCVENVIDLCEENDLITNILQTEEFENIRYIAEDLQSFVVSGCSFDEVYDESVTLYQEIKYCLEALEQSIQDAEVLREFSYIRAAVYVIRSEITKL